MPIWVGSRVADLHRVVVAGPPGPPSVLPGGCARLDPDAGLARPEPEHHGRLRRAASTPVVRAGTGPSASDSRRSGRDPGQGSGTCRAGLSVRAAVRRAPGAPTACPARRAGRGPPRRRSGDRRAPHEMPRRRSSGREVRARRTIVAVRTLVLDSPGPTAGQLKKPVHALDTEGATAAKSPRTTNRLSTA